MICFANGKYVQTPLGDSACKAMWNVNAYWDVLHAPHVVRDQYLRRVKGLPLDGRQLLHCHLPTGLSLTHNLQQPLRTLSCNAHLGSERLAHPMWPRVIPEFPKRLLLGKLRALVLKHWPSRAICGQLEQDSLQ